MMMRLNQPSGGRVELAVGAWCASGEFGTAQGPTRFHPAEKLMVVHKMAPTTISEIARNAVRNMALVNIECPWLVRKTTESWNL